jgi:hypothetical protein
MDTAKKAISHLHQTASFSLNLVPADDLEATFVCVYEFSVIVIAPV